MRVLLNCSVAWLNSDDGNVFCHCVGLSSHLNSNWILGCKVVMYGAAAVFVDDEFH